MIDYILSLSKQFIKFNTIPEYPDQLISILDVALSELDDFTIERFESNGIHSALVYNTPNRPDKFKLLLNGHLDIIPAKPEQFNSRIVGDKLYGAGAMDMKSNVACMIAAFKQVASNIDVPIALQLVTDEEVGGFHGTKYQVEKGVRADFVLAGEPTNFDIVYQAKGVLWLKIIAKGLTAHGAYPWRGKNAIWMMHDFLTELRHTFPIPSEEVWKTTVNIASINTKNSASNKIPDTCEVQLDIRFISEDSDSLLDTIQNMLPDNFDIEILANEPAMFTPKEGTSIQKICSVSKDIINKEIILRGANGTSDARHFSPMGSNCIEFGPIGDGIGSDEEWVSVSSLDQYYNILVNFMNSLKEKV